MLHDIAISTVFIIEWALVTNAREELVYDLALNQSQLVAQLRRYGLIKSDIVAEVMENVDRGKFVPNPPFYVDRRHDIGYGAYASAPYLHAYALEELKDHLKKGNKAMDIGSGCGYLTVCMANMVGNTGRIIGIEHMPGLVHYSLHRIIRYNTRLIRNDWLAIRLADGRNGMPYDGPYDAIHVGASSRQIPKKLWKQLKRGGRMVIPIGIYKGNMYINTVDKWLNGTMSQKVGIEIISRESIEPLIDAEYQWKESR